ncbi:hypothetical protein [Bradyrhizobium elkanii]|uniref:hypothetical protein n=1 Tax=Bradyrhizobium elkanii TaxID=29448 RepID=UPI0004029EF5|nr:hypothetical protein [Bradyrhizobium elkanii]
MLVVELGGPTMFAQIRMMRALNRGHVRRFNARKVLTGTRESSRGTNDDGWIYFDTSKELGDRDRLKVFEDAAENMVRGERSRRRGL